MQHCEASAGLADRFGLSYHAQGLGLSGGLKVCETAKEQRVRCSAQSSSASSHSPHYEGANRAGERVDRRRVTAVAFQRDLAASSTP